MAGIRKSKKHAGLLLLMLTGLGLACLVLPETAAGGAAPVWAKRYPGADYVWYISNPLALDSQGNVYVTAWIRGAETGYDYLTIKYSPNGRKLWARRYNGPGNGDDRAAAMTMDSRGNVYVTGGSLGKTNWDWATVKYSPDGRRLWVRRYQNGNGGAKAIALDSQDNIYVSGEWATIKYDPDGRQLWVRPFEALRSHPAALAVDNQENAYILGDLSSANGTSTLPIIKYDPNGQQLWMTDYQTVYDFNPGWWSSAIALDAQGNAYVAGGELGYFLVMKYSPEGQKLWAHGQFLGGNYGKPRAIAVDGLGNVYVTGTAIYYEPHTGAQSRYLTIKYSPAGQIIWIRDDPGGSGALALDGEGNVYVTGYPATIKYNPEGQKIWEQTRNGGNAAIALDRQGNVYVTGTSGQDLVTTKYIQTPRNGR